MVLARTFLGSALFAGMVFAGVPGHKVHSNRRDFDHDASAASERMNKDPKLRAIASFVWCRMRKSRTEWKWEKQYYIEDIQSLCNDDEKRKDCKCTTELCGGLFCAPGQLCATCTDKPIDFTLTRCNQVNNPSATYCDDFKDKHVTCKCAKLAYSAFPEDGLEYSETSGLGSQDVPDWNAAGDGDSDEVVLGGIEEDTSYSSDLDTFKR